MRFVAVAAVILLVMISCMRDQDSPPSRQQSPQTQTQQGMSRSDLNKVIGLIINTNGMLCAEVVSVSPLKQKDVYEVRCIEYRGGTGTVDYIMNAREGTAFRR